MFSPDAKAATLLESYKVLAEEVRALAEMEASQDIPDEDIAEAIVHISRAMRCVAGARAFCVDLCETPRALRHASGCSCFACVAAATADGAWADALARAAQAGVEAVEKAAAPEGWKVKNPDWPQGTEPHLVREDEEEEDILPVLNRPSPDRPVRFNVDGIGVWAKTYFEAEQILMDTRAALLSDAEAANPEAEEVKP